MTKKDEGTKFKTLEAAFKEALLMDFKGVLEYKVTYHRPSAEGLDDEYWTVSRKLMQRFAFGKPHWVKL